MDEMTPQERRRMEKAAQEEAEARAAADFVGGGDEDGGEFTSQHLTTSICLSEMLNILHTPSSARRRNRYPNLRPQIQRRLHPPRL